MKRSLVIYLPNLHYGGVERIYSGLAPSFVQAGFDVTFLLHRPEGAFLSTLPPEVRVVSLGCRSTLAALMPLTRFLRRERPDILLSGLGHNNIIALWARGFADVPTKIIVRQPNALSAEAASKGWKFRLLPLLYRRFLHKADGIVAISQGVADDLARMARLQAHRISVIYNPIVFETFEEQADASAPHDWLDGQGAPVILGVGRFVAQKDFATLISAFAKILPQKKARLILLGDGPLHNELKSHAERLGVADHVSFVGFHQNPLSFMRRASLLVLSSRHEGFGNVLAEAMACGTPVVSTDCPHGPAEILDGGRYGRLVPVGDADAIAQAIRETLDRPLAPEILKQRGYEFSLPRAMNAYLQLFDHCLRDKFPDLYSA